MRRCFKRSKQELRGPWSGLKRGLRSCREVRSVPRFAEIPDPPAKLMIEEVLRSQKSPGRPASDF
eukprot:15482352-Alexandrium_andersonii.AAC.1